MWEYYLWDTDHEVTSGSLESLERDLNVKLPQDYLDVVMIHQGKVPSQNKIQIRKGITSAGVLFLIDGEEEYLGSTVRSNVMFIENVVPPGIVPFMGTGGGSVFAFDFRSSRSAPSVVFIDSDREGDEAIMYLSDSFGDFLSLLQQ